MRRIAVLGVVPSLTWRVARCLFAAGVAPVVISRFASNPVRITPEGRRYVALRDVRWVNGELDPALVTQIEDACRAHDVDAIMAADLDTTLFLARHRLAGVRTCAVPSADDIGRLHDKWRFTQLARDLGVPVPESRLVTTREELGALDLGSPFITKPLALSDGRGFRIHRSIDEAQQSVRDDELPVIAQAHVDGFDVGFSFLARDGAIVARSMFEHHVDAARTFFTNARLIEHASTIVRHVRYRGVGHFDLRYSTVTRDFRFLELNPRFWGSLLYARQVGVNYPKLLIDQLDVTNGETNGVAPRDRRATLPLYERALARAVGGFERARLAVDRMR